MVIARIRNSGDLTKTENLSLRMIELMGFTNSVNYKIYSRIKFTSLALMPGPASVLFRLIKTRANSLRLRLFVFDWVFLFLFS